MPNIFISYSHKDSLQASQLADRLRAEGHGVWIDQEGIAIAASWSGEIVDAIESCGAFIVLLSHNSVASEHVLHELSLAFTSHRKIVPVELEKVELPREFRYHLAGIQRDSIRNLDVILGAIGNTDTHTNNQPSLMPRGGSQMGRSSRWIAGTIFALAASLTIYMSLGASRRYAPTSPGSQSGVSSMPGTVAVPDTTKDPYHLKKEVSREQLNQICDELLGQLAEAVLSSKDLVGAYPLARKYAELGNAEYAMSALSLVIARNPAYKAFAQVEPDFNFMKDDPRFRKLVGLK